MKRFKKLLSLFEKRETPSQPGYFQEAQSWADDIYIATLASRERYRVAFYITLSSSILLTVAVCILAPLQHAELVVVHQGEHGPAWVELPNQSVPFQSLAQTESDIAQYVMNRESYDAYSFQKQFELVQIQSNNTVFNDYYETHNTHQTNSLPNQLGIHQYQIVSIESINFLDHGIKNTKTEHHTNLAEVNFTVTTYDTTNNTKSTESYVAIISWNYLGTPRDPISKWRNWNGFQVVSYHVKPRVIHQEEEK